MHYGEECNEYDDFGNKGGGTLYGVSNYTCTNCSSHIVRVTPLISVRFASKVSGYY